MKTGLKNFFASVMAYGVPILSILLLVLICYIPRSNAFWNFLRFSPFYAGIYFWQSLRPDAFNSLSTFLLGILADVLSGAPLGVNIMSFLMLYMLSYGLSIRFNIKKFSYAWLLFTLAILPTLASKAILISVFYRTLIPLNFLLFEFLLTAALYPLFARIYILIERRCIHLEEQYEKI